LIDVVIAGAVRTPIGRMGGSLKDVPSGHLAALVIQEAMRRAKVESDQVNEVIMGEVRQSTESSNVARVAALRAGVPESVPAYTVNRLCASAMQAIWNGAQLIQMGQADTVVVGGVENMSRAPIYLRNSRFGEGNPYLVDSNLEPGAQPHELYGDGLGMGITAENVAAEFKISREDQDRFALESQLRAKHAIAAGRFKDEIIPVTVKTKRGEMIFSTDEHPRETSLEQLAALKPAFRKDGCVTAGNACGRSDGAAALVLLSSERARQLAIQPLARIIGVSAAGVSPELMGIGPVPAVRKLLDQTGFALDQIDLIELNEAFASQSLACLRELGLDQSKVNVNGGAIALGHPLGATGCRIVVTLLYEMMRRQSTYGLATLCVGGGQGMAMLIERLG
jgi:acetyl-CoA C-acetyltransferase